MSRELTTWRSVGKPVGESVGYSANASVYDSVLGLAEYWVDKLVRDSVLDSVWVPVRDSVWNSVSESAKEVINE